MKRCLCGSIDHAANRWHDCVRRLICFAAAAIEKGSSVRIPQASFVLVVTTKKLLGLVILLLWAMCNFSCFTYQHK